jgi:glycosyltransferase involved in cell wall biosynthesis/GT2 family glycosyltransferase
MERRSNRPAVSVVVPFAGERDEAVATLQALGRLTLSEGDEIIVSDNSADAAVPGEGPPDGVRVVRAAERRSSYYARNIGGEAAANEWLLFLDSDCRPKPGLLDSYLPEPVADDVGAVAGEVLGAPWQDSLAARYARSRRHLCQEEILFRPFYRPMAVTANLLVRRSAWASVGGFFEGIKSGGDADFSWRLQDAGWRIAHRPEAVVHHLHRETLRALARQATRIGAGWAWARRRHPDYPFPSLARRLARCAAGVAVWTLTGRFERAKFKAVDALWVLSESVGYLLPNAVRRTSGRGDRSSGVSMVILLDEFPTLTETFVLGEIRALQRGGNRVRVEAASRPARQIRGGARGLDVDYWEDDGIARKLASLVWLVRRSPGRCARDLISRRRWRRHEEVWPLRSLGPPARRIVESGEAHLHAHFAAGAALNAMRLGALLDLPYSVTVHAYDVFQERRNLREKLDGAAFSTGVCASTVEHLRALMPAATAPRIQEVGMGVDGERFRRRRPHGSQRTVVAVGRLVEKKGFSHLLDAAAILERSEPLDRLVVVGDGPLRRELEDQAVRLGIEHRVVFTGTLEHDEVRAQIEGSSVLVMPSVVAADGDRDSLPVVVEEALALEVPVVASDLAGLPEVVRPEWGRIVPPADADMLAAAITEVLNLNVERRAKMGRAGRAFILEHRGVDGEAARLAALVRRAGPPAARRSPSRDPAPSALR